MIVLVVLISACSGDVKETPKGHKYTLVKEGSGEPGAVGQFLLMNMIFKDASDSIWNDSRESEIPMIYPVSEPSADAEGIDEILPLLRKGDSVVFSIPARVLFENTWKQPTPEEIDPTSKFTFQVGVYDILTEDQLRALEQDFYAKRTSVQLNKDLQQIDAFLASSNIEAMTTQSGLRYTFNKQGKGANAVAGNEVAIHYAGYLMDGTLFDTSMESVATENNALVPGRAYEPLTLTAGGGQVIPGWEEAILLMNKGAKLRVWIPSTLAYGPQRRSALIKENSILVFDMEMVDIK